jgi:hypothetical protein
VGDRLAALADDGASRHARHQDLEVVRSISASLLVRQLSLSDICLQLQY